MILADAILDRPRAAPEASVLFIIIASSLLGALSWFPKLRPQLALLIRTLPLVGLIVAAACVALQVMLHAQEPHSQLSAPSLSVALYGLGLIPTALIAWTVSELGKRGLRTRRLILAASALGVLACLFFIPVETPRLRPSTDPEKIARRDLGWLEMDVHRFRLSTGRFPTPSEFLSGGPEMLPRPAIDPWGNAYDYETDGDAFVLRSRGPDAQRDTNDDIDLRSSNRGLRWN